jgi:hypothetical protein
VNDINYEVVFYKNSKKDIKSYDVSFRREFESDNKGIKFFYKLMSKVFLIANKFVNEIKPDELTFIGMLKQGEKDNEASQRTRIFYNLIETNIHKLTNTATYEKNGNKVIIHLKNN